MTFEGKGGKVGRTLINGCSWDSGLAACSGKDSPVGRPVVRDVGDGILAEGVKVPLLHTGVRS